MRWKFCVVPESGLPGQKTIALQAVHGLTSRCGIGGHRAAVEALTGTAVNTRLGVDGAGE